MKDIYTYTPVLITAILMTFSNNCPMTAIITKQYIEKFWR